MIKVILFDFDGTISDARKLCFESFSEVLTEQGCKFDKKKLKKLMGVKTTKILNELGIETNVDKIRKLFYKRTVKGVKEEKIKLCVPIKPLQDLKKEKIKLIVISNSRTFFLKASIKILGIKKLFDKLYGSETFDTKDKKLEELFRKMKIRPVEAMYVGDRFSDIDYAREAGCYAVAIHNKCAWSTKAEIMKEKPDFIIKDFKDLKRIVKEINSIA